MATMTERLAYVLDFNTAGAVRDVQKFGDVADRELGKADERLDRLAGGLTRFGVGAMAFAGTAGLGLFKLGQGAAEAEANMAALEQVVGDVVASEIAEWADDSARAVGLASKDAVSAATSFAQLGKIIGLGGDELSDFSTDLVGLSSDFAAFKDVSPEQALQDIQAAFAGSTEVMRKYGIFLDDATLKAAYFRETGEEVSGTLTAQQKIIAINSELYRQGADMIGQWERESGELNGQQATLRANMQNLADNIGKGVLPMLTSLTSGLNVVGGAFADLSPEMQSTIGRFAALGTAGIGLVGTLSFVAGQVIKMRDRFTVLNEDGTRSLNGLGKAARGLGVGIGVAGVALAGYSIQQQRAADHARDAAQAMQELSRVADDQLFQTFNRTVLEAALGGQNLDEIMRTLAQTNIEGARRLQDYAAAQGQSNEYTKALTAAIADEDRARKQATETAARYGDTVEGTVPQFDGATSAIEGQTTALDENAWALGAADRAAEEFQWSVEAVDRAIDNAKDATNDLEDAAADLEQQWQDLKGELDEREAFLNLQSTFDGVQSAAEEAFIAAASGAEDAESAARDHELATIDLKNSVIDYGREVLGLPPEAVTEILSLIDQGSLDEAERKLNNLTRARTAPVRVGGPIGRGGNIALKTGGPVPGPKDAPVPITAHGGEFVLSADVVDRIKKGQQTLGAGSGTPPRPAPSAPTIDPEALYDAVRRAMRDGFRDWRQGGRAA